MVLNILFVIYYITCLVEDPSEDFVSMRDAVDCHYLVDNFAGLFESPHRLNKLTKELLIKSRETTKINNVSQSSNILMLALVKMADVPKYRNFTAGQSQLRK